MSINTDIESCILLYHTVIGTITMWFYKSYLPLFSVFICVTMIEFYSYGKDSTLPYLDTKIEPLMLVKRQGNEHIPPPKEGEIPSSSSQLSPSKGRKRKRPSLPASDQRSINAAKIFLSDDDISLQQAIEKEDAENKQKAMKKEAAEQKRRKKGKLRISSLPKLFSDEVLRQKDGHRDKGHYSNAQLISRSAQSYLIHGRTNDRNIAIQMAQRKIAHRNSKKSENLNKWREIARSDPSKARLMNVRVPTRLATADYIPCRAHQLHHWGKACDMETATKMASDEAELELDRKKANRLKLKGSLKRPPKSK